MCRTVIGQKSIGWNKKTLLSQLGWMDIRQTLSFVSNKLTYTILHNNQPELLAKRFQKTYRINPISTRLSGPNKLGPRPKSVGRTMVTKRQFRAQAYDFYSVIPEDIKSLSNYNHFTKWVKTFYKHGATTAYDKLPRFGS